MSWRMGLQAARLSTNEAEQATRMRREALIILHLRDMRGFERLQEFRGVRQAEFRIIGFDAKEEAIRRRMLEALDVEERVMRLRQLVESKHAKNRGKRRAQHGELERDGNE